MHIIGIDPGLKGGIAILDNRTIRERKPIIEVWDMPVRDGEICARTIKCLMSLTGSKKKAVVEMAGPHRGQGLKSTFTFGRGYGKILAALEICGIEYLTVPPATWKKALGLSADKKESARLAHQIYKGNADLWRGPNGGVKDGRCEAALLAWWGRIPA